MLIKSKCKLFFFVGDLIKKTKNPKPVVTKKIKRIKRPLEASAAKEWTLVNIPDLTKKVPIKLKRKAKMDKNKTQDFKDCFFSH